LFLFHAKCGDPKTNEQIKRRRVLEFRAQWERQHGISVQININLKLRFVPGGKRQSAKKTIEGRQPKLGSLGKSPRK